MGECFGLAGPPETGGSTGEQTVRNIYSMVFRVVLGKQKRKNYFGAQSDFSFGEGRRNGGIPPNYPPFI